MERILLIKENLNCTEEYAKRISNVQCSYSVLIYRLSLIIDEYNTLLYMASSGLENTLTYNCILEKIMMDITTVFDLKNKGNMLVETWNNILLSKSQLSEKHLSYTINKYYFTDTNNKIKIPESRRACLEEKYRNDELISIFKLRNNMIAHNNPPEITIKKISSINSAFNINELCEDIKIIYKELLINMKY